VEAVAWMLEQLWAPIVAVTAAHDGRRNGLISSTVLTGSLLPEAPRVSVQLSKASLTHELVEGSGAFAVHLLPAGALELFHALGMRSGRDGDKLGTIPTTAGVTGSPLLTDAVAYIEARVVKTLDAEDTTIVLADVVAGARLRDEAFLTIEHVRAEMPPEWEAEWQARLQEELREARRLRQAHEPHR
jgi:flavin reductase (DIM6/NTAB) family NADH-FMN oxidoreductase RutF